MRSEDGAGDPSADDLANWFAAAQTGKGTPLLESGQVRALLDYAYERSASICNLEAYEITEDADIPIIERGLYGDDLADIAPWETVLHARAGLLLEQLLLSVESGKTMRFLVWVTPEQPPKRVLGSLSPSDLVEAEPAFAALLEAVVADGASIGFLHPMKPGEAHRYWRQTRMGIQSGDILMWAISDDHGPIATIQLHPASKPNGVHRAEVAKLMVHPRARGQGLAKQLMATAEQAARDLGRRLLVLDTVEGSVADGLYRRLGWTEAGKIPDYALKSGGGSEPTVVFWKSL